MLIGQQHFIVSTLYSQQVSQFDPTRGPIGSQLDRDVEAFPGVIQLVLGSKQLAEIQEIFVIVRIASDCRGDQIDGQIQPVGLPVDQSKKMKRILSLIHISEPTRRTPISYDVF